MRREPFLFPPIVPERERSPLHCEVEVSEAELRAKIRPSFNRARNCGPRIESKRTSPAFKSSAEILAVAGTTIVQSTVPE